MFTITINEKAGQQSKLEFYKNDVTIGRMKGNDIVLPRSNISKLHATLMLRGDSFTVQDHGSTNGTFVNGVRINGETPLKPDDMVYIGEFVLQLEKGVGRGGKAPTPPAPPMTSSANTGQPPQAPRPPRQRQDTLFDPSHDTGNPGAMPGQGLRDTMGALPEDFSALNSGQTNVTGRNYEAKPFVADTPVGQSPRLGLGAPGRSTLAPEPTAPAPPTRPLPVVENPPTHTPVSPQRAYQPEPATLRPKSEPPVSSSLTGSGSHKLVRASLPKKRAPIAGAFDEEFANAQRDVAKLLFEELTFGDLPLEYPVEDDTVLSSFDTAIDKAITKLAPNKDRALLKELLQAECAELGVIERYLADETIQDIYVNRFDQILIRKNGQLEHAPHGFSSIEMLSLAATRLLGAESGEAAEEIRFLDGTRAHIIRPPLTPEGAVITIRKPVRHTHSLEALESQGFLSGAMREFLEMAVQTERAILIAGPHTSGKSTLLGALAMHVDESARMVVIEDYKHLILNQKGAVRLESSSATGHDKRFLLGHALAMNPEKIVLDVCSGPEAYDLVTSVAAGTQGNLMTIHGIHAQDAVQRLESLCLLGAYDVAPRGLREQISHALDIIVVVNSTPDGGFRIQQISELQGVDLGRFRLQDIFYVRQEGQDAKFIPTGYVPTFYEELHSSDASTNLDIFRQ